MAVDGLTFAERDEGSVAGQAFSFNSSDPTPGYPLSQALGPFTVSVAADTIVVLWLATASPLTRFDYFKISAGAAPTVDALDGDGTTPVAAGQVELTCNNLDAAEQIFIVQLMAGLPFKLYSNISRYSISAGGNGFAGTADVIDHIRYKNTTSAAISVTFALAAV
jgi:hypothetical protein